jgi:hypothetical protein
MRLVIVRVLGSWRRRGPTAHVRGLATRNSLRLEKDSIISTRVPNTATQDHCHRETLNRHCAIKTSIRLFVRLCGNVCDRGLFTRRRYQSNNSKNHIRLTANNSSRLSSMSVHLQRGNSNLVNREGSKRASPRASNSNSQTTCATRCHRTGNRSN